MLNNILERMKIIHMQKVAQWGDYDKKSISYAVHGEEIEDAKFAITAIETGTSEEEIKKELEKVFYQTTSSRIYELLGELFFEHYIPPRI